MSTPTKPAIDPRTSGQSGQKSDGLDPARATARRQFVGAALGMTWQLAVVFLVPVIAGAELDKALKTGSLYTLIGLALAVVGSGLVMWRALRAANQLPVPKLSEAQKRAIRKAYEEDDE